MGLRLAGGLWLYWRQYLYEGRRWLQQVLALPGAEARTAARAQALLGAGALAFFLGDFLEAQRLLEESVSIGREMGTAGKRELANALELLGNVALLQGNPDDSRKLAAESLQVYQELGETWGIAMALCQLGRAEGERGDLVTARSLLEESAERLRVVGDRQRLALPLNALGEVALEQGEYTVARARFEEALAAARETEDEQFIADALANLGRVAFRMGEYHESLSFYQQSLALNREQGPKYGIIKRLAGLAEVASLLGQLEQAAELLGAVEVLREETSIRLTPLRRAEYDRTVEGIRAKFGEAAFAKAWARGRTMSLEEVLAAPGAIIVPALLPPEQPSSPASQAAPPYPHDLTQREVEVLRLVAAGSSNQEIADALVISERTVNSHLVHIFNKLSVNSRAAAAAFAFRHKLAE
jgi:non-specific serine/threonine protein kinase